MNQVQRASVATVLALATFLGVGVLFGERPVKGCKPTVTAQSDGGDLADNYTPPVRSTNTATTTVRG